MTTLQRDTYCSFCGTPYELPLTYPRSCLQCGMVVYANPIPVAVVLQPIVLQGRTGLLVVRRGIPPQLGKLALVGGFVEETESWQVGGAREVLEEASVAIEPASLRPFWFTSTEPRPNRVLLFSVGEPIAAEQLAAWEANAEATARGVVFGADGLEQVFAFSLHAEAVRRYFAARGEKSEPHAYTDL
jgi:ADP-ribose pyrophosphatase YjhB (NUDIX family)